jgi:hypothetical protein
MVLCQKTDLREKEKNNEKKRKNSDGKKYTEALKMLRS